MDKLIRQKKIKLYIFLILYFILVVISDIFLYFFMGLYSFFLMFLVSLRFLYVFTRENINFKNIERFKNFFGNEICKFNSRLYFTNVGLVSFNNNFFIRYEDISYIYKYLGFSLNGNFISKLKIVSNLKKRYTINFFTPFMFSIRMNNEEIKKFVRKIKKYNPNVDIRI